MLVLCAGAADAQRRPPASYPANTTRMAIPRPPLPVLGPAGFHFVDPGLGSRILRVTDANTRPGFPGRSFVTASAAHQLAWNATSDTFWLRGVDGTYIPYAFDAATMTASRINATPGLGDGGLTIVSQVEPQFSFVSANLLYGTRQASDTDHPVVRAFDFNTGLYTDILDLGSIASIENDTYARSLSSSAAAPERLSILFGGSQQDLDYKVAVFQAGPPVTHVAVLDSLASTITRGGVTRSTNIGLGINLHHAWIDLSGRYVTLYPTSGSFPGVLPYFIWDLTTDLITKVTQFSGGHDALGYGRQVNQDCCEATRYDGAQWQSRDLSAPAVTSDLVNPVSPQEVFIADHTSWNNAQPGALVPVLSTLYRYDPADNATPWRAWDDEIVAMQTDAAPAAATVWRFAQHRSDISYDGNPNQLYFWYLPRATISPDGRWALFTSNWEKTLGSTVGSDMEPGGLHRNDVFIVDLTTPPAPTVTITTPTVAGGAAIEFTVANGPANTTDWVALFPATAPDTGYVAWAYLNGSHTPPASGMTGATLTLLAPRTPGTYEVRLFAQNGFTRLASSAYVTVTAPPPPTMTISTPTVTGGGAIGFTVANGPANTTDWVGLFPTTAADTGYVAWTYLNGSHTPPASGMADATLTLTAPQTPGTYHLRLFAQNGSTRLATSADVTVTAPPPPPPPAVTITTATVSAGGAIGFTVANGPANTTDWVGLFPSGAPDSGYVAWTYLSGTHTPPATGMADATLTLTAPQTPGTYHLRLFAQNAFSRLATSADVTVTAPPPPTVTITTATVPAGGTIEFTVANGPANTTDWVGLFPIGAPDSGYVAWIYLTGTHAPPASGMAGATLTLTAPPSGTYNVRWFAQNGSTRLATSETVTVP